MKALFESLASVASLAKLWVISRNKRAHRSLTRVTLFFCGLTDPVQVLASGVRNVRRRFRSCRSRLLKRY